MSITLTASILEFHPLAQRLPTDPMGSWRMRVTGVGDNSGGNVILLHAPNEKSYVLCFREVGWYVSNQSVTYAYGFCYIPPATGAAVHLQYFRHTPAESNFIIAPYLLPETAREPFKNQSGTAGCIQIELTANVNTVVYQSWSFGFYWASDALKTGITLPDWVH